jgi:predicted metalloprotease
MRWRGRRKSTNVDDRRGRAPAAGMAIGGVGLVIAIVVLLMGGDPSAILQGGGPGGGAPSANTGEPYKPTPAEQELADFCLTVLADTEDVWNAEFRKLGRRYEEPRIVFFSGRVKSACGFASAAVGPFYCPGDKQVYIDLSFFQTLRDRLGAPGDFAQAYVIAHEVGHHVQHLLGYSKQVDEARRRGASKTEVNRLTVRLELQADFLAGLWAHHAQRTKQILEEGDIDEALNAAHQIGDDTLQKKSQGYVVPDSFTHGSAAQRAAWFRRGFRSGDLGDGNTFDDALFQHVSPR